MFVVAKQILILFGFTKHQMFIATVCILVLLGNFAGGLMRSIFVAYAGPRPTRKLTESIAFRLALVSELALIVFALYYHGVLISFVEASHIIYWIFTLLSGPILAFMGSQITYMVLQKRIESNKRAYRKWEKKMRAKRLAARESRIESEREAKQADTRRTGGTQRFKPHS